MDPESDQADAKPQADPPPNDTLRQDYILAELRCAHARLRLAMLDVEAVGLALNARLITAEQAVAMLWDSDAVHYTRLHLGLPQEQAPA
jgi:hypothetical protein